MKIESYDELRARLLRDPEIKGIIQRRAYEIYLQRGAQPGRDAHDWLQAESEVLARITAAQSQAENGAGSKSHNRSNPLAVAASSDQTPAKKTRATAASKGTKSAASSDGKAKPAKRSVVKKSDKPRSRKKKSDSDQAV